MKFVRYLYFLICFFFIFFAFSFVAFAGIDGEISPVPGSDISTSPVEVIFYGESDASCRLSMSDEGYDDMSDDVDCEYDGWFGVFFCTSPDLGAYGQKMLHIACMDGEGNKDSSSSNEDILYNYVPNVKDSFSPISGSTTNTPTMDISFYADSSSSCRLSLSDEGYDDMSNDINCSFDEDEEQYSCSSPDLGVFGEKKLYVACVNEEGEKDLASQNSELIYYYKPNNIGEYISEFPQLGDYEVIKTMALSEDGSVLYVGGQFTEIGGVARNYIAAIDTETYAVTDWYPQVNGYVNSIEVSGEDIYIGGTFTEVNGESTGALVRLSGDGTLDLGCSTGMSVNTGGINSIAITDDYIYAGGDFLYSNEDEVYGIARFENDSSCSLDSSWMDEYILSDQYSSPGTIYTLKSVGDNLYIGGDFVMLYDPVTEEEINTGAFIRVDLEGAVDMDCLPNIHTEGDGWANGIVYSLDIDDGYIYIGGDFDYVGEDQTYSATKLNLNSCIRDSSWEPSIEGIEGSGGIIFSIQSHGDEVFLGGSVSAINGLWTEFAKIDKVDGDMVWSSGLRTWGMSSTVYDMLLDNDMLYVGGAFDHILLQEIFGFAAFPLDIVLPTGGVSINLGKTYTVSPNVNLTLTASDISGIREMVVCDNSSFSGCSWELYTSTKSWSFSSIYGTKTIYVKYMDSAGNISSVYSDSIIFHTPSVRITKIGTITDIPDNSSLTYYFTSNSAQISGITQSGSTVYFKYGGNTYSVVANGSGIFSITLNVPNGSNDIEYYSKDVSGNESVSRELSLVVGTEYFPEWLLVKLGLVQEEPSVPAEPEEEVKPEVPEVPEQQEEEKMQTLQFLDDTGKPLVNASLEIEGKKYITDSKGEVKVSGLQAGERYKVSIDYNGKKYDAEVLGASETEDSIKVEVTNEQRVVDWKRVLLYSGLGIGLVVFFVIVFRKKKSLNE